MGYWAKKRKTRRELVCKHHWEIEGGGALAKGKCRHCGEEKTFVNFINWNSFVAKMKLGAVPQPHVMETYAAYLSQGGEVY